LEVNPNPDISPQSGMARALKVQGITYRGFVGNLIERALRRKDGEIRRQGDGEVSQGKKVIRNFPTRRSQSQ
jgi:hypothetical protein